MSAADEEVLNQSARGAGTARLRSSRSRKADDSATTSVHHDGFAAALGVLDQVLGLAVDQQARLLGPATLLDPWRGMRLEQSDIKRLLDVNASRWSVELPDTAGIPELLATAANGAPRAATAAKELNLSAVDLASILIVLAPDLDLRYERIYGYLQDDITKKRPSVDLIANLLATTAAGRLQVCGRFAGSAPLQHFGFLNRIAGLDPPPLGRMWRIDDLWRKWLLAERDFDACLGEHARLLPPTGPRLHDLPLGDSVHALLGSAVKARYEHGMPLRVLLQGPHGAGKFATAKALAVELRQTLLVLDLHEMGSAGELRDLLLRAQRAALLFESPLYLHGIRCMIERTPALVRVMIDSLEAFAGSYFLACAAALPQSHAAALPWLRVTLGYPGSSARRQIWSRSLAQRGLRVTDECLQRISARFSLSTPQIEQAAAETLALSGLTDGNLVDHDRLAAVVRAQCGTELALMAQKISPRARFDSLVVPKDVDAQLREIGARVATRDAFASEWSAQGVHARATGVTVLFLGPSGTGKTLSAEALACELGLDMFRIDLAGVVSKYIGETEKNLDRVFGAAENANAVLFFDEADALFGKRSEVKDAHDRYANIEVAYLLQKMEQFDGLAVLATNLKQNLDDAFARRLTFTVTFPFPEEPERRQLWEKLWPNNMRRAADVDLDWFAHEFRLAGGNIRNVVLAAAHAAAAAQQPVSRQHLLHATRREYQKLGKNLAPVGPVTSTAG